MGVIAVVIAGGRLEPPWTTRPTGAIVPEIAPVSVPVSVPEFDAVIAVDGGLDEALLAGLTPTVLLGDLDSVSPAGLQWAAEHDVEVVRHPADKDDTDTALALAEALRRGGPGVDVVVLGGATTDRFDHLLGSLGALGAPELAAAGSITAHLGATDVLVLHPGTRRTLSLEVGRTLSLLALHGTCSGVGITGVRWPLSDTTLRAGSTLGISNETRRDEVEVSVGTGVLTVVVPPPLPEASPA